jgi:hypothetical protein
MLKEMITMNDRALYQLERAIDALSTMVKILREEQIPTTFTGSGILGAQDGHSSHWFDYNRNDRDRLDPFNWHSGATGSNTYTTTSNGGNGGSLCFGSASPDVITFS